MAAYHASANDPSALETARANFQSIVKGGGHRAADAQKIADEINAKFAALSAAASATASAAIVRDEIQAVLAAVQRYADAFDHRDADALRQVWPLMTTQMYGKFKDSFAVASGIHLQLANQKVDLGTDRATAVVNADITQQYTPKGEKMQTRTDHAVFRLAKISGNWVIQNLQ
jgi:hypothetical protein